MTTTLKMAASRSRRPSKETRERRTQTGGDTEQTPDIITSSLSSPSSSESVPVGSNIEGPALKQKEQPISSSSLLLHDFLSHDSLDFHLFTDKEVLSIRKSLLTWYHLHRRRLPWRGDSPPWKGSTSAVSATKKKRKKNSTPLTSTSDDSNYGCSKAFPVTAYGVWVSEIMLQQTRVEAVIPYWVRWMKSFPTIPTLAAATSDQVNAHWAGLGFYARARRLHEAAQYVVQNNLTDENTGTELPRTVDELMKLPGIGRYTASAIASIVHNVSVPVVDGNVCRVLSRLKCIATHVKNSALKDVHGWTLAQQLVDDKADRVEMDDEDQYCPGDVNQALMELGATYCAPSGTGIEIGDPLRDFYGSTQLGRDVITQLDFGGSGGDRAIESLQPVPPTTTPSKLLNFTNNGSTGCPLCDNGGVEETFLRLTTAIDESLLQSVKDNEKLPLPNGEMDDTTARETLASKCGHSVFPMPPPKKTKREEVLAVAVMSCNMTSKNNDRAWLLVRRPQMGLLAGQWEFPSITVWTSDSSPDDSSSGSQKKKKKKRKVKDGCEVPVVPIKVRRQALDALLTELGVEANDSDRGSSKEWDESRQLLYESEVPMEHVFSHVRHTMWRHDYSYSARQDEELVGKAWVDASGRHVRWMFESDMQQVGVTSGVKKILRAVEKQQQQQPKTNPKTKAASKRPRRR